MSSVDPTLSNRDLAPTTPAQRTWTTYSYIALWFSMSMEITTYQLASSLIAKGMDWKQAVGTVLLGNLIVLIPMLLNAHAGTRYGIPFPVFIRAPFGVRGANLPAHSASRCCMRMVRHPVLDRRHSDPLDAGGDLAWSRRVSLCEVGVLSAVLVAEHGDRVAGCRVDPASRRPLARPSCSSWRRRC